MKVKDLKKKKRYTECSILGLGAKTLTRHVWFAII